MSVSMYVYVYMYVCVTLYVYVYVYVSNSLRDEPPPCQQSTGMSLFVSDSCVVATEQRRTGTSNPMKQLLHCGVTCLRCDKVYVCVHMYEYVSVTCSKFQTFKVSNFRGFKISKFQTFNV